MDSDRLRFIYELMTGTIVGRNACPVCGTLSNTVVGRKHAICLLRRCKTCELLYRTPIDATNFNWKYYQYTYREGTTTDVPDAYQLEYLKIGRFAEMEKNIDNIIDVLRIAGLKDDAKILDFGCSWGYGAWQFVTRGYACRGYEISRLRAKYAEEKLGIELILHAEILKDKVDLFFSSHVLEHVPNPMETLKMAVDLVRSGGLLMFITPNGSQKFKEKNPTAWNSLWGRKHPTALDEVFYQKQLRQYNYLITSTFDASTISEYIKQKGQLVVNVDGPVLYCLVCI